jgi:hypothetical protein
MSQLFYNWTRGVQAKQYNTFSVVLPGTSSRIQTFDHWFMNQVFYYCPTWGTNKVIEPFFAIFLAW